MQVLCCDLKYYTKNIIIMPFNFHKMRRMKYLKENLISKTQFSWTNESWDFSLFFYSVHFQIFPRAGVVISTRVLHYWSSAFTKKLDQWFIAFSFLVLLFPRANNEILSRIRHFSGSAFMKNCHNPVVRKHSFFSGPFPIFAQTVSLHVKIALINGAELMQDS